MPAQSKAQQKFMGLVHALQKGDVDPSDVSKDVRDAASSMSKKSAKDFASTKHSGLPSKKEGKLTETLQFPLHVIVNDLLPGYLFKTVKPEDRDELHKVLTDLRDTLNDFYKRNNIKRKIK
jgi:hypothetical protein